MAEEVQTVDYDGTQYTKQEAAALATWLADPCFSLLNRRFTQIRNESVDAMDSGMLTLKDAEEMIRQCATRLLIKQIQDMGSVLLELLEDVPESVSLDK